MLPQEFFALYLAHESAIEKLAHAAAQCHADVNQTYGDGLPYAFHLRLAASYVTRFGHLVLDDEAQLETLYAAAYFHDTLEDARLTYNDLTKLLTRLNAEGCAVDVHAAVEAVYALTNDKGRNREERAGERYYAGIRATPFAPFLKMCDRLANLRYSTLFGIRQRMADVYRREMPHFLEAIGGEVPAPMVDEALRLCDDGYARP
ncbi:MAG: phosphodiesterase [Bacteroidales bacterium]|nr:phosphodiesterase [Bacteroidales bacterium]